MRNPFPRRALHSLSSLSSQQGLSAVEIAFGFVVMAGLLAGAFFWVRSAIDDLRINVTVQQLQTLIPAIRAAHPDSKVSSKDNLGELGIQLQPELQVVQDQEKEFGNKGLFDIWHGEIWNYPGNAQFWGGIDADREFSVIFEKVPSHACAGLANAVAKSPLRDTGLVAVFVAPEIGDGQLFCLATDGFCKLPVKLDESMMSDACHKDSDVMVAFTYTR